MSEYHGVDSSSFLSKLGNRALRFSGIRKIWDFLFLNVAGYFARIFIIHSKNVHIYLFWRIFFSIVSVVLRN